LQTYGWLVVAGRVMSSRQKYCCVGILRTRNAMYMDVPTYALSETVPEVQDVCVMYIVCWVVKDDGEGSDAVDVIMSRLHPAASDERNQKLKIVSLP